MPILNALIAATAFGLSAPLSKLLLDVVSPLFLAGLLYLGAGVFLGLTRPVWRRRPKVGRPLTPRDRGILAALVLVGGVLLTAATARADVPLDGGCKVVLIDLIAIGSRS